MIAEDLNITKPMSSAITLGCMLANFHVTLSDIF